MQHEVSKYYDNDDEPTIVVREDEHCPICGNYNGHSLSCATFRFNRIEGSVSSPEKGTLLIEGSVNKAENE